MKVIKIILSIILLFGIGKEYGRSSIELGTYFHPLILPLTVVLFLLCTWLLGSAFSKSKFSLNWSSALKSISITSIIFVSSVFLGISDGLKPSDLETINGIRIPLGKCINGNKDFIANKDDRKAYCRCYVEKITNDPILKEKYTSHLESNRVDFVIQEIQAGDDFFRLEIESCAQLVNLTWTKEFEIELLKSWEKELNGTEFGTTNNIEKYCSCLLEKYKQHPLKEILSTEFMLSEQALEADKFCTELSLKNSQ